MTVYFNKALYITPLNFQNIFSKEETKQIIELGEKQPFSENLVHSISGPRAPLGDERKSSICFLENNDDTLFVYHKLYKFMNDVNNEYYGFDLKGIETLQYSVYKENDHYGFHTDIYNGDPCFCRKLSITVNLTDPKEYEGGDLEFITSHSGPWTVDHFRALGSVTVFPSYLIHRVSKVKKGIRRSLVVWFIGPGIK